METVNDRFLAEVVGLINPLPIRSVVGNDFPLIEVAFTTTDQSDSVFDDKLD